MWGALAGIAIDPSEQIWTFNRGAVPVQVYTAAGELVRSWGQGPVHASRTRCASTARGTSGWSTAGCMSYASLRRAGKLLMTFGTAGEPGEDSTHFNRPTDVAIAPSGEVFVTDGYGNNRVVHFDEQRTVCRRTGAGLAGGAANSACPIQSLSTHGVGSTWPTATMRGCKSLIRPAAALAEWRDLLVPWHIVITERDEIYVCGSSPMRWPRLPIPGMVVGMPPKDQLVMVFTPDGRVVRLAMFAKGQHSGELDWVHAMAVDASGNLYLGDIQGKRAQKFLRVAPADKEGEIADKSLPKRDEPVERAGKP